MHPALLDTSPELPPETIAPPLQALWWLRKASFQLGTAWDKAHGICQTAEGTANYDWVHALAHLIEGDTFNANYWYRRAGRQQTSSSIEEEWQHIATTLSAELA